MAEKIVVERDNAALFENRVNSLLDEGWKVKPHARISSGVSATTGSQQTVHASTVFSVVLYR